MSESTKHPSDRRILAFHDAELAPAEAEEVRVHCASCARCGEHLREIASVGEMLSLEADSEPLRPAWPVVRDRLTEAERRRFQPAFGVAAAAAVAAGIVIGVVVGQPAAPPPEEPGAYLWSVVGSSLGDGDTGNLSGAWTRMAINEGEEVR